MKKEEEKVKGGISLAKKERLMFSKFFVKSKCNR